MYFIIKVSYRAHIVWVCKESWVCETLYPITSVLKARISGSCLSFYVMTMLSAGFLYKWWGLNFSSYIVCYILTCFLHNVHRKHLAIQCKYNPRNFDFSSEEVYILCECLCVQFMCVCVCVCVGRGGGHV